MFIWGHVMAVVTMTFSTVDRAQAVLLLITAAVLPLSYILGS